MEMRQLAAVEPSEWFVVFHRKSMNRLLSFLAFGEFKHVSAFGYCAGFKAWVVYDVRWSGTSICLMDQSAVIEFTQGCDILKIARTDVKMGPDSRLGLYCVTAIKHLIGLRCVAMTPDQLYRHILRNGGLPIREQSEPRASTA